MIEMDFNPNEVDHFFKVFPSCLWKIAKNVLWLVFPLRKLLDIFLVVFEEQLQH